MEYNKGDKVRVVKPRPENDFEYSSEKYKGMVFTVYNNRKFDDRVYVLLLDGSEKLTYLYFDEIELEVE